MINIQKYIQSTLVLFGQRWSILPTLVLFDSHWSYLVYIGPIQSNLSSWSYLVDIGPIRSTMILFGPICSYSVHIGPLCSIQFTLVLFSPTLSIWSTLFHLVHLCSLQFIWTTSIHFNPLQSIFVHLHTGKRHVQTEVENTYSKSKFIIYIYIYISQTHNIQNLKYGMYCCYTFVESH